MSTQIKRYKLILQYIAPIWST